MDGSSRDVPQGHVRDEPRYAGERANHRRAFEFFTTAPEHGMDDELLARGEPSKIGISLLFKRGDLSPSSLGRLEQLLDRVFASPKRQYDVTSLSDESRDGCHAFGGAREYCQEDPQHLLD